MPDKFRSPGGDGGAWGPRSGLHSVDARDAQHQRAAPPAAGAYEPPGRITR